MTEKKCKNQFKRMATSEVDCYLADKATYKDF